MKYRDRVRFGSDREVLDNLRALSQRLNIALSQIPIRDKSDYSGFALTKLLSYTSSQLTRLVSIYQYQIDLHAWVARNLFEAYLLCEYILQDSSRAKEFLAQKAFDELQINEGFIGLSEKPNDAALQPIRDRNEHIKRTLANHAIHEFRPWHVSFLAKQTGNEVEYDAFFKLYSKYVHASSWLVCAEPSEANTPTLRNIFLLQAQYYVARILKLAEDYSGSSEAGRSAPSAES